MSLACWAIYIWSWLIELISRVWLKKKDYFYGHCNVIKFSNKYYNRNTWNGIPILRNFKITFYWLTWIQNMLNLFSEIISSENIFEKLSWIRKIYLKKNLEYK